MVYSEMKKKNWKILVDFWHSKLALKVWFWHFLTNRHSSTDFSKKIPLSSAKNYYEIPMLACWSPDQTSKDLKVQNPISDIISWDRENFFPANAKHLHLCGFWPPWPHFRRKSDEEAGSSRDFHAISRLKGGSLIIHSLRFPNAKKKLLLSHAIFKGQQFDHMQSLPVLTYIALSNYGLKLFLNTVIQIE